MQYVIEIEGLAALEFFGELTPKVQRAASMALNKTIDRTRTAASRAIRQQVNFPASYLNQDRLGVRTRASVGSLEAMLSGRDRATSLARFVKGAKVRTFADQQKRRKVGEVVKVKTGGGAKRIDRGFIISLRNGNLGFAVRTSGGPPPGAYKPKELGKNLWLLYGPSINQVLYSARNQGGVFEELTPETMEFLNKEFQRLMELEIAI